MTITTFNKSKTLVTTLNSASGEEIIPVFTNTLVFPPSGQVLSVNAFIKNLKAYSFIKSLDPIKQPDFTLEDSETDKLYKTLDIEWNSPRKQLNLYVSEGNDKWYQVGAVSLLNPSGYPYRVYNLLDLFTDNLAFELGENGVIGVQISNVGHGVLINDDIVNIYGSYIQEIIIQEPNLPNVINVNPTIYVSGTATGSGSTTPTNPPTPTPTPTDEEDDFMALTPLTLTTRDITVPTTSAEVIPANPNRKYLAILNNDREDSFSIYPKGFRDFRFTLFPSEKVEIVTRGGFFYTGAFMTDGVPSKTITVFEGT